MFMSKANNSVVSMLSTLTKHATISQSESFFRMVQIIELVDQATKSHINAAVGRRTDRCLPSVVNKVNCKSSMF